MYKLSILVSLLLIGVFTTTSIAQDLLSSNLTYGKYQVGFKAVQTLDHTRPSTTTQSSPGRAMQLYIWYPSEKVSTQPMRYKDYLTSRFGNANRTTFFHNIAELGADTALFVPVYPALIHTPTRAYHAAPLAKGVFPLVIYPDQVHLQNVLCEYLASQGFIVVSPVVKGPFSESMQYNPVGIETGVADLQFALGYLRQQYSVKRDFAVMGLGFSATLALALQMRNTDAKALVSLEGGITTGFEEALIQRGPYYDLERCNASMLVIHAPHPDVNPEIVNKYKYAERIFQHYPQSAEFYFLNFGIWERSLKNILPKANRGNTWQSFEYAAQSIQHYLKWKLNQDAAAKTALLDEQWPNDLVETSIKTAVALPPSTETLLDLLKSKGFEALTSLYAERKKSDPQPFSFGSFYQIGQHLIGQSAYAQLLDWAKFYAEAFPNSAIPFTLQGRANLELGNKTEAKALYEKALALLENDADLNTGEKSFFKTAIENRIKSLG
ncbi:hypothetical protein [Haliscomenobacter hydrossis]|uniref:Uncharacterized protein n=1 Tax=Haliscomenobacter hydrossis (strain ATCC 27775 / DSM 1100 / LMG 10767 / O) TaxID=760192 RepID=F4L4K0_HALH1|nr:hypothetical protein [Haliscomenobacter hydrossis]AEE52001.1 hypothetical protein Halhy_4155 [Haliscomenobacter hydrossis DSM 1100]